MITLKTIDAHVAGQAVRLVVDGFPSPRGKTMRDKQSRAARDSDRLRRIIMQEPRGHQDLVGAILTEPVAPGAHAGLLFMNHDGWPAVSASGAMAAAAIALAHGLLLPGGDVVVFDTPAGSLRSVTEPAEESTVVRTQFVPSFVQAAGVPIALSSPSPRHIRADIAFGGALHAIVDGESVGLPIDTEHMPELRRLGRTITAAVASAGRFEHPHEPGLAGIAGSIFTGPPSDERADLRTVSVLAGGSVDRSPAAAMCAVMAVLNAMGLLQLDQPFTAEGILGTRLTGHLRGTTMVGEVPGVVPEVEGRVWITGEHTFFASDADPLVG